MALGEDQRRRFARHLLLAELSETAQQALCGARVAFTPGTNAGVRRVASDYLRRAGVSIDAPDASGHEAAGDAEVEHVAGEPAMRPAAEALLGALEAVEQIKRITGAGTPAAPVPHLTLSREES